jgi:HEAT repeat protein
MDRAELIETIKKGGNSTIYKVIDLLNEDDPQTRNFVSGVLLDLGIEVVEPLKKYLELELSKPDELKTALFYVIDILSDLSERSIVPLLHKMLNKCSSEEQQLFVYEALAKLGEWDTALPVLEEMIKDENLKDFRDIMIISFGHIYNNRSFSNLAELYDNPNFQYTKSLILDAAKNILMNVKGSNLLKDNDSRLMKDLKNGVY